MTCLPFFLAEKHMRTGDIIAFGQCGMKGRFVKIFSGSSWVHTGLLWRKSNEKLYVVEVGRYDCETGLFIMPIKKWLSFHYFRPIGWLPLFQEISDVEMINCLKNFLNIELDEFVPKIWMKTILKRKKGSFYKIPKSVSCSEFTMILLQKLDIVYNNVLPESYGPWEIFLGNIPFKKKISPRPIVIDVNI